MNESSPRDAAARKQRRDLIGLWIFFLVWSGGALAAFYLFAIKASSLLGAVITAPMALLGVYFIWRMTRVTADDVKFGVVSLTPLLSQPACPGGRFEAVLQFHDRAPALTEIDAELRCIAVTIFRRSQSGVVPSEQVAWSSRKKISLRNNRADIAFDIPGDAPVTNLPGERQSESGWHSLPMEAGKALQYHRWEIFVTAGVPGIDLERNFPVIVEPGRKSMAASSTRGSLNPAVVPLPNGPRIFQFGVALAVFAFFIFNFVSDFNRSETREKQLAAAPAITQKVPVQVRELLPQTPWTRDTRGWDLPMPAFSRAIGIAAKGIHSTREKDSERFVFDQILIEMNPAWSHMNYFDVMVTVTYFPADLRPTVTLGGFSTRLDDVRGSLTADVPAHALRDLSVTVPLPKGDIGRTEVTLGINAHLNDPSSNSRNSHERSRTLVLERK
jgi:hypothetical protein